MFSTLLALLGQCVTDPDSPSYKLGKSAVAAMADTAPPTPAEKEFLSVPSAASARASLKHITSRPHVAGTPGDYAMATYVRDSLRAAGITNADIDPQRVLLTYPLELVRTRMAYRLCDGISCDLSASVW